MDRKFNFALLSPLCILFFCVFLISATCESSELKALNSEDFGQKAKVSNTFTVTNKEEWEAAIEAIKNGGNDKSYVINVTKDVTGIAGFNIDDQNKPVYTFGDVTGLKVSLRGSGSLALGSNGSIVTINAGQSLILRDLTLNGKSDNNSAVLYSGKDAELFMYSGTISDNTGGGVEVDGNFTMSGGTISGNTSEYSGAGVAIQHHGNFTMSGGTISSNNAQGTGGGVDVAEGSFTMSGGDISNNTTHTGGGGVNVGGLYVGTFTMTGGSIINNTVVPQYGYYGTGGGVDVDEKSSFTKTGGTISGNTAPDWGDQVIYGGSPRGRIYYRDADLGEGDNLSTGNLSSGWTRR
jgi:hypothetical protein